MLEITDHIHVCLKRAIETEFFYAVLALLGTGYVETRLALNSQSSSCLCYLSAGIKGVHRRYLACFRIFDVVPRSESPAGQHLGSAIPMAEELGVQGHPLSLLHSEFKTSLGYMRLCSSKCPSLSLKPLVGLACGNSSHVSAGMVPFTAAQ